MTDTTPPDDPQESIGRLAELIGGDPLAGLDADMAAVLAMLGELGARPIENLIPEAARRQPTLANAVAALMARAGTSAGEDGVVSEDVTITGAAGDLPARIYRPRYLMPRLNPMVLYFHGGGFVSGDLDSHDGSARALARRSGAIVLSVDYRLAPEHAWPAAQDDAFAAWTWLGNQAHRLAGDPQCVALAGEDAGANLAVNVALRARDAHSHRPVHQLLIHPMAGTDLSTPSYGETLRTRPIGPATMRWRLRQCFPQGLSEGEPLLDLVAHTDLAGLPPASIILARMDPLRSEGEALAAALEAAGTPVTCSVYDGVVQGFFGLGQVITKALFAQGEAGDALTRAFAAPSR